MNSSTPYALAIALSAFLLFQVQMVTAKWLLPWFGGVPAVWITCMVAFQCLLVAGYAYAHELGRRFAPATQRRIHLAVLGIAVGALVLQALAWRQPLLATAFAGEGLAAPVRLLALLTITVGAPFLALSATNPLMQRWFRASHPAESPWRLFAASNLGSLMGLLSYPFATEPWLALQTQAWAWSLAFAGAAGLLAWASRPGRIAVPTPRIPAAATGTIGTIGNRGLWLALSACGAALLVATSARLTHDVATIPLLWVLPLALYLASFILCFDSDRYYPAPAWAPAALASFACVTLLIDRGLAAGALIQVVLYGAVVFVGCMLCHGELARTRPAPEKLTGYYLWIAAGGALGGLLAGTVAPLVLPDLWELGVALVACAGLWLYSTLRQGGHALDSPGPALATLATACAVAVLLLAGSVEPLSGPYLLPPLVVLGCGLIYSAWLARRRAGTGFARGAFVAAISVFAATHVFIAQSERAGVIAAARNFFGIVSVLDETDETDGSRVYKLRHGRVVHGLQWQSPARRRELAAYYAPASGVAMAWRQQAAHPAAVAGGGLRVGVIGLGTGSLAAYARAGDHLRFYEINPAVVRMANGADALFSFLHDSPAESSVVTDDGRLALQRELSATGAWGFHLLVVDAFNGHAIPMHLLTLEALDLYLAHLDPERGVLALHITNQYLDLAPLVRRLAAERGLSVLVVERHEGDAANWPNTWALLAHRAAALPPGAAVPVPEPGVPLWTDQHSALWPAVRLGAATHIALPEDGCPQIDCPALQEPLSF